MKTRAAAMLLSVLMLLSLLGCGGEKEEPETPEPPPVEAPEPEPVPEPDPEPVGPSGTNPLTGLPMEEAYEANRPVAVMFNNLKAAQPQLGVSQADIIYEIPAEGSVTRMLGVFQTLDGVGTLGSIRSTRAYYLETALGHDAVLVHAGGSPEAYEDIPAWGVDNIDGVRGGVREEAVFWRDADRRKNAGYEHSLLTSGENIQAYLDEDRCRTEHKEGYAYPQTFVEDGTPAGGTPAEHVKLYFTSYKTGTFDYDTATGRYLVGQYGGPHVDGSTGDQVSAVNVLFLETDISVISGDKEGRLRVRMTGEGQGTYFCGGKSIPIQWSKTDRNSPFVYRLTDGAPLALQQGSSYICILDPDSSRVEVTP